MNDLLPAAGNITAAGDDALDGHMRRTKVGAPSLFSSKGPPITAPINVPADGCTSTASLGAPSGGVPALSSHENNLPSSTYGHFI